MLEGWRRFNKEKPKTKNPFAYYLGIRGLLVEKEGVWEARFTIQGHRVRIPAIFFHDLLFLDDFRCRKQSNK